MFIMKYTSIEEQLTCCKPPEEIDYEHHYQLRRALLESSYFEDSFLSVFCDHLRYYVTRQGVVIGSMILLIGGIGVMGTFSIAGQKQDIETSLFSSDNPTRAGDGVFETEHPLEDSEEDTKAAFAAIQEEDSQQTIPRSFQFVSFEGLTAMMLKALSEKRGRLLFDSGEDPEIYVYSFASSSPNSSVSPFFSASVPQGENTVPDGAVQLISH